MAENEVSTPEFSQNVVPAAKQRGRIGKRLREHVEDVIDSYVTRLRSDPAIPTARTLPRPLLEDHAMSYLGDLFQTLVVLEEADDVDGRDESALLRDGSKIQHLVSELHGRQRHRLGWTESALQREYAIIAEEVESFVRRHAADGEREGSTELSFAVNVLRRLLGRGRDASLGAYSGAIRDTAQKG
jgi:hypothetical protein